MSGSTCKLALVAALGGFFSGCVRPAAPIALGATGVRAAADYSDLAFVLDKVVTSDGLIIPAALKEHAGRLETQLERLAVTGPNATPQLFRSPEDRIAYWCNARAAWAMKLALVRDCPKRLRREQFIDRDFSLDGRMMNLRSIDETLKTFDDWRVLVASPGVTLSRCRLPATPFSGRDVRRRIAKRINAFIDDERRFVIDIRRKRILIPPVLWQYRDRLIQAHHRKYATRGANLATALLPYLSGSAHRRLQDAIGYRIVPARPGFLTALFEDG